jgi:hypothetical protein
MAFDQLHSTAADHSPHTKRPQSSHGKLGASGPKLSFSELTEELDEEHLQVLHYTAVL